MMRKILEDLLHAGLGLGMYTKENIGEDLQRAQGKGRGLRKRPGILHQRRPSRNSKRRARRSPARSGKGDPFSPAGKKIDELSKKIDDLVKELDEMKKKTG